MSLGLGDDRGASANGLGCASGAGSCPWFRLDAWRPAFRVSEVVEETIDFSVNGTTSVAGFFELRFHGATFTEDEIRARGGTKFKLLEIRTC